MTRKFLAHLSQNAVAYLALFIALGGTSVAAVSLKKNSVRGKHIASNSITSPKVKDKSLKAKDFAAGQLPRGAAGPAGPAGPAGTGQPGPPGEPGSARAFALVVGTSSGANTVDDPRSKNVSDANVTHPAPGIYCFNNLPFTFNNVVATAELAFVSVAAQGVDGDAGSCPGDEDAQLRVQNNSGVEANASIFVLFN